MHQGQRALHGSVVEVQVEAPHLRCHQHALVHDRARAHGAYIEYLVPELVRCVGALLDGAAAHVQLAFEGVPCLHVGGTCHERLEDGGHASACGGAEVVVVHGDLSPKQHRNASLGTSVLEDASCVVHAPLVLGTEDHGDTVVALVGEQMATLLCLLAEEAMGHLEQDARAITRVCL